MADRRRKPVRFWNRTLFWGVAGGFIALFLAAVGLVVTDHRAFASGLSFGALACASVAWWCAAGFYRKRSMRLAATVVCTALTGVALYTALEKLRVAGIQREVFNDLGASASLPSSGDVSASTVSVKNGSGYEIFKARKSCAMGAVTLTDGSRGIAFGIDPGSPGRPFAIAPGGDVTIVDCFQILSKDAPEIACIDATILLEYYVAAEPSAAKNKSFRFRYYAGQWAQMPLLGDPGVYCPLAGPATL